MKKLFLIMLFSLTYLVCLGNCDCTVTGQDENGSFTIQILYESNGPCDDFSSVNLDSGKEFFSYDRNPSEVRELGSINVDPCFSN